MTVGVRMTTGSGWKLAATKGKMRVFPGTLLSTHNFGNTRIAIFSVPKETGQKIRRS